MEVREPSAKYLAKPAYKQTEVGVIPEDWNVHLIGELLSISAGRDLVRSEFSDVQDDKHPYPIYSNARSDGGLYGYSSSFQYGRDSVTVTARGDVGHATHRKSDFCAIGRLIVLAARQACDLRLVTDYINTRVSFAFESTGVPQLTAPQISSYRIALPSTLCEQQAIADALSDGDALIEALEQLLAKKRQIKQGAMQELLTGQKRLPGFAGEWNTTLLGAIGDFLKGSGVTRDEAQSGALPCVRYGEIYTTHNDYIRAFHSWISPSVAANATRLKRGDLLFAGSGETKEEIGKCVAFLHDTEAYAGGDIVILRPRGFDSLFMGYALNTGVVNRQKASRGQGDAVVHISAAALAEIVIHAPSEEEQSAIATILADMDAELAALEAKLAKARHLKQGMMQELLTGRIRLV